MTANAPPVLWVVFDRFGFVTARTTKSAAASDDAKLWNELYLNEGPHRVVAYVPRDTP